MKRSRNEKQQTTRLPIKRANGTFVRNNAFDGAKDTAAKSMKSIVPNAGGKKDNRGNSKNIDGKSAGTKPKVIPNVTAGSLAKLSFHELEKRRHRIKLEMGDVCEQILQAPGKGIRQNRTGPSRLDQLMRWCNDPDDEVSRLALISGHLVFNDILPSYRIRVASESEMASQMKKETRQLREFERRMLGSYQRYLKHAGNQIQAHPEGSAAKSSVAAVRCLSALLRSRPNFNFRSNIIAVLVPLMGSMGSSVATATQRGIVRETVEEVFSDDMMGAVSLEIVHVIGKHVKTNNYQLAPDVLRCLFRVKLKVDLKDDKKMKEIRRKKSKRKKMDDIAKGMEETSGAVDQVERNRCQAKMLEDVFTTFFRIIRKGGSASPLLPVTMECVARFSHLINMELVVDLLEALSSMVRADNLPLESAFQLDLAAMRTLRGPGAELQMDDTEFVAHIYKLLPRLVSCSPIVQDGAVPAALEALREAFVIRREHSLPRAAAFVKRMLTVSTSLVRSEHTLAMLSFARLISNRYNQLSQFADSGEDRVLSNAFLPFVDDPDQSNALGATIWEAVAMTQHYHPTVAKSAVAALKFSTLEPQFTDPASVLRHYSTKSAGFNPTIKVPSRNNKNKKKSGKGGGSGGHHAN